AHHRSHHLVGFLLIPYFHLCTFLGRVTHVDAGSLHRNHWLPANELRRRVSLSRIRRSARISQDSLKTTILFRNATEHHSRRKLHDLNHRLTEHLALNLAQLHKTCLRRTDRVSTRRVLRVKGEILRRKPCIRRRNSRKLLKHAGIVRQLSSTELRSARTFAVLER